MTFASACESWMSAIVIQTLFRCVSETSIDWCGLEGVYCDVIIAQTNDTWKPCFWACNDDSFAADCKTVHNVAVSNSMQCQERQLRYYESIEIIQIDSLSECICGFKREFDSIKSTTSASDQKRVVDVDAMLRDPIDI
jgi:hypothetical protein